MRLAFFAFLVCAALPAHADFIGHGGMVRAVDLSPNGQMVVSAGFDYSARLWDFATQTERLSLRDHDGPVNAVAFARDKTVLSTGNDGLVRIWSAKDGHPIGRLKGHTNRIVDIAVSKDGTLAATAGWDRTVRLWDLRTLREARRLTVPSSATAVAFSADGEHLFSGHKDGGIRVWRVRDGTAIAAFPHHNMAVTSLAPLAGGERLLSASIDGTVRIWNIESARELFEMKGHDGPVFGVAARPGHDQAVSVGRDGKLLVWDLRVGREVRAIAAHDGPAWGVGASPDGRFALTSGSDGSIRTWHIDSGARIGIPGEGDNEPKPWLNSLHPGAKLYRTCAICHALTPGSGRRSGPHLAGLFGRKVGTVPGYHYSDALTDRDFSWNEDTLFRLFSEGPDHFLPGTKMPVQKVPDARALRALIDYLKEITG